MNKIVIEVSDTGNGIDEKIANKIFDPFFSTKEKSLGLGLSIAYKIVSDHSGSLKVKKVNDKTVFSAILPVDSETGQ